MTPGSKARFNNLMLTLKRKKSIHVFFTFFVLFVQIADVSKKDCVESDYAFYFGFCIFLQLNVGSIRLFNTRWFCNLIHFYYVIIP
jgi:hypothetical protein